MNSIYKSLSEFKKSDKTAYYAAHNLGYIEEICKETGWKYKKIINKNLKPKGFVWTLELCKQEALKYKSKKEWKEKSRNSMIVAYRNGWIEECCVHMIEKQKPKNYWTLERCIEDALKYKTRKSWEKNSSAYSKALACGWLDECCKHMKRQRNVQNFWTLERCKLEALKFKSKKEWNLNSMASYSKATKSGWVDECCKHMKK